MKPRLSCYCNRLLFLCLIASLIVNCRSGVQKKSTKGKYLLLINGEKGSREHDSMIWFDSLDSSLVLHTGQGTAINERLGSAVIPQDSFLLSMDKKTGTLEKYPYSFDGLSEKGKLTLGEFEYISFTTMIGHDQLYISGRGRKNISSFAVVDTKDMKVIRRGKLALPVASGQNPSDNFGVLKGNRFYVGYSSFGEDYDHCSDTSYLAVMDYPSLKRLSLAKDTKSAFPGAGVNGLFNYFQGGDGAMYILTSPVFYHGNHPTAPTAFYRIGAGRSGFDPSYFFDLSSKLGGVHLLGITQAGGNQVILSTTAFPSTGKGDYYLADVKRKTLKLLLKDRLQPNFVWGTSGFYDGVHASFIVNEKQGESRIYVFDVKKGNLRKGPAIRGAVSPLSSFLMLQPS